MLEMNHKNSTLLIGAFAHDILWC